MTIRDMITTSVRGRGNAVALRHKRDGAWHEIPYTGLMTRIKQVAEILADLKVRPGDRVAIYLPNCVEWPEIYLGIVCMGATAVPVDAKLREQEVAHILRDSESTVLFASARTYPVVHDVAEDMPQLSQVVLVDGRRIAPEDSKRVHYRDFAESMDAVRERADSDSAAFDAVRGPTEDDIASIIYTSGTTGRQKGAMLTHANFCSNCESCREAIEIETGDNFLLVLPLHHALPFTGNLLLPLSVGAEISFIESLKTVGENVREVSPTVLIAVPLLLEKMYAKIKAKLDANKVGSFLWKIGFRKAIRRKILAGLGGKMRIMVVGGAPASPDVLRGFSELGVEALEGYGLTETAPVLTLNPRGKPKPGTVGTVLPNVEVRIVDAGEDGSGEIVARGPNVMKGYYRNPEATEEVFREGWFLTGDLGSFDEEGYLTISGRKKSLIVNREGKNIYPEEVEAQINSCPLILESLVLGCTVPGETGERVGVIVVPDHDALDAYAERKHSRLSDEDVQKLMRDEVRKVCEGIAEYKRPRRILVRQEEFEKTSTSKIKRYLYDMDVAEDA